jgi:hypothetical protein
MSRKQIALALRGIRIALRMGHLGVALNLAHRLKAEWIWTRRDIRMFDRMIVRHSSTWSN